MAENQVRTSPLVIDEALALYISGVISPEIALSRMLLEGADAAGISAVIHAARPTAPAAIWWPLEKLLQDRQTVLDTLAAEILVTGGDHTAIGSVQQIAAFFDRAVIHSPEAGVALHSLGDPTILKLATDEIVTWLRTKHLVECKTSVLDLGCGFGRIAAALSPHCRQVLGLDVSSGMVAEARRRMGHVQGLHFEVTDGCSVPPGPFDLVLLVDSMPYILQAGLADAVILAAGASLSPTGAIVLLNLSYGRSDAADRREARRWAADLSLRLTITRPFSLWDGVAFVFQRGRETEPEEPVSDKNDDIRGISLQYR